MRVALVKTLGPLLAATIYDKETGSSEVVTARTPEELAEKLREAGVEVAFIEAPVALPGVPAVEVPVAIVEVGDGEIVAAVSGRIAAGDCSDAVRRLAEALGVDECTAGLALMALGKTAPGVLDAMGVHVDEPVCGARACNGEAAARIRVEAGQGEIRLKVERV